MDKDYYDIAVIGGGPAGIIASGIAAQKGARVILLEKNNRLGKKLLLTGKGRCNITNAEYEKARFIDAFGKKGKFLYSSLHFFGVEDTVDFFHKLGLSTKIERGGRVFPESDRAEEVLSVLLGFLNKNKVVIKQNSPVLDLIKKNQSIDRLRLTKEEIKAEKYILCTGGLSYPVTGSTGDGLKWAEKLGHTVIPCNPGLVSVRVKEEWVKELQGLSLKNVRINIYQDKKQDERFGEALFTHDGLSGPIILDMSKTISELQKKEDVELHIDYKPALEYNKLDERIQRDFKQYSNKIFKNSLASLLPRKLIPVVVLLSGINSSKQVNNITKEERKKLVHLLKNMVFHVKKLSGFTNAVITIGGIALNEIDPRTMKSKIIDNLYFAGEIIDLDGPTGGYNLQVCWSTGYLAGKSVF